MSPRRSMIGWVLPPWTAVLLWLLPSCQAAPRDPYSAGERALAAGHLVDALRNFDSVPVHDLRYPEARLTAAALERRLRRHKELVLLGLRLRGEWRDDEALVVLQSAMREWPGHPETRELIDATEGRLRVLGELRQQVAAAGGGRDERSDQQAVDETDGGPVADPGELLAGSPDVAPAAPVGDARAGDGAVPRVAGGGSGEQGLLADQVAVELARLALASSTGEMVVADLQDLHRRWPHDPRITRRLARIYQQRGLMHYGDGDVAAAITDWQRALDLDPDLQAARVLFDLATTELARPPR